MKIGEILEIIADDPAAEADIRSLAKNLKQKILGVYRESLVLVGGWAPYFIIESFKSSMLPEKKGK